VTLRFEPDPQEVLRRRDEYVRRLFQHAHDSIHIIDERGVSVFDSSTEVLGYELAEVLGRDNSDRLHPEDRDRALTALRNVFSAGRGGPVVYRIRHRDGTWRSYEAIGTRHVDDDGRVLAIVNTREITERLRAEAELEKLQEQLRHAQKLEEIGRLAGGIAHDFNNLLTAILGYAEQLEDYLERDSPAHADLLQIRRAGERAAELTRHLLAFSRKQVLQPRPLDLNDAVRHMMQMLPRMLGPDIHVELELEQPLRLVHADAAQIEQVLLNLAVNARDAMPDGGRIAIATENVTLDRGAANGTFPEAAGPHVVLRFADTGCGIPADVLPNIFDPFFTTKPEGLGTGLGLSMVYGLLKQSGGEITVASTEHVGTTFTIYLPAMARP
jgi:PAS domain S-box-containing protein